MSAKQTNYYQRKKYKKKLNEMLAMLSDDSTDSEEEKTLNINGKSDPDVEMKTGLERKEGPGPVAESSTAATHKIPEIIPPSRNGEPQRLSFKKQVVQLLTEIRAEQQVQWNMLSYQHTLLEKIWKINNSSAELKLPIVSYESEMAVPLSMELLRRFQKAMTTEKRKRIFKDFFSNSMVRGMNVAQAMKCEAFKTWLETWKMSPIECDPEAFLKIEVRRMVSSNSRNRRKQKTREQEKRRPPDSSTSEVQFGGGTEDPNEMNVKEEADTDEEYLTGYTVDEEMELKTEHFEDESASWNEAEGSVN